MNYSQLVIELSQQSGVTPEQARDCADAVVKWIVNRTIDAGLLSIPDFGKFEIVKHDEYILHDRGSRKRFLVPPHLSVHFLHYALLNDDLSEKQSSQPSVFVALAEMLVRQNGLDSSAAEKLAIGFFKSILVGMDLGEAVEVDGLGSFLLTKVRVGQRVYGKVLFTPDEKFSATVNRPFDFFEQEELHDGIDFDDIKTLDSHEKSAEADDTQSFLISNEQPASVASEPVESSEENAPESTEESEVDQSDESEAERAEENEQVITEESEPEALQADGGENTPSADGPDVHDGGPEETEPVKPVTAAEVEATPGDSADDADVSEEAVKEPVRQGSNMLRNVLIGVAGILLLAGIAFWLNKGNGEDRDLALTDTLSTTVVTNVEAEGENENLSEAATTGVITRDTLDYQAMNAQIPYGAYDIVGVDTVITVMKGQTLEDISRFFLGTDILIYLTVLNDGNTTPQEGEKYKIPKLKLRKRR